LKRRRFLTAVIDGIDNSGLSRAKLLGAAAALIRTLLSDEVQVGLYAELGGQSSAWLAWAHPGADAAGGGFYRATRATVEQAWVRPRFAGYPEFQATASAVLREGLLAGAAHAGLVRRVNELFAAARAGRSGTAAFADVDAWFLIRAVTAPDADTLPRRHQLVLSRGPYHYNDELTLLREHRVDALVTKNSGGAMTRPKLDAAAALGVAVVMVDRPPLPSGVATVATPDDAAYWVRSTGSC